LAEPVKEQFQHLPLLLIILDGWGIAPSWGGNAIAMAKTPVMNDLWRTMPHTQLKASEQAVGLPRGVMGNSEVGHLNIGAGKVVKQFLPLIDDEIKNRHFFSNPVLVDGIVKAIKAKKTIHLVGILSDGGVHGHINHLFALIELCKILKAEKVAIHALTDGRDTEPTSAIQFVRHLEQFLKSNHSNAHLATISGRYYAMDRDNRWERTEKAYQAMVFGQGKMVDDPVDAISKSYKEGIIDEFIEPMVVRDKKENLTKMSDGDLVICYNFRSDRMRQIVKAFCQKDAAFKKESSIPKLNIITFTSYQTGLPVSVAFNPEPVDKSLAECVAEAGLHQFHVAETEKYAHVTYFFNGGAESPVASENRLLIPSPKVATYNKSPEMSAKPITKAILEQLNANKYNFYVINFANADMVGHTGDIRATITAVETIDKCIDQIWKAVQKVNGTMVVTADHGNAEEMVNPESGLPDTEHTNNPVPLIVATKDHELAKIQLVEGGCLGNVAPTVLQIIGIIKPKTMVLNSLISQSSES
jgi:2,3-bisphosphoglycerate-independent phosphoglycerate mutase